MSEHAEDHVDCSETMYRIMEYLDGEMTEADHERIAEHLRGCQPCLDEHDLERMVKALVKRSCGREQAPAALRTTIMQSFSTYSVDGGVVQEFTEIRYDG
ncbi:mycothiol system anti-sigma-R factor [Janibacter melonis]|uniref:mycothiol system anti-sigma-R factor n=1 Tax=Janibacter melonis TaxID=262209 RepID=UPI0020965F6A|nr:mycothiol system anti-sigma-R factor [Janibacter melonis]